ncbi:MAG: flagellin FliC [Fibrobacteres bacterium]|nr:flagellin FliC [Fibrobacterota bacterium]
MRIYNNVNAINTQNTLLVTNRDMSKSLEKLSTGLRINRASDDAAGLSVSEGLRTQIRGSDMARRNANDGLAMLQIAEAGTQQITDSLQRMRELAIQSANGTYANAERAYIDQEYQALASEISRIALAVTYNGIPLLATTTAFSFQISAAATGTSSTISFQPIDLSTGLSYGGVSLQTSAQLSITSIDALLSSVLSLRALVGATMNRLEATVTNLGAMITNYADAESRVRDTDFAMESTKFTRSQILTQSANSMLSQANQLPNNVLSLLQ